MKDILVQTTGQNCGSGIYILHCQACNLEGNCDACESRYYLSNQSCITIWIPIVCWTVVLGIILIIMYCCCKKTTADPHGSENNRSTCGECLKKCCQNYWRGVGNRLDDPKNDQEINRVMDWNQQMLNQKCALCKGLVGYGSWARAILLETKNKLSLEVQANSQREAFHNENISYCLKYELV